jgi:5'-3' exonuclease
LLNKSDYDKVFLIDSTGFVLKYWFSMPPVETNNYESISAFLGFSSFVIGLLRKYKPVYISFAFDESLGTCFRNKIYPDYKKSRENAPEELKAQLTLCREFLDILGLDNNASNTYEADDILYTVAKNVRESGFNSIILTNDKDLYQLVHPGDIWWDYKSKIFYYDDLLDFLGFVPQNLSDFLGLMGDSVDNIPGAPGLGEKTAMTLMSKYKDLESLMKDIDSITDHVGMKFKRFIKIIKENKKIIYLSKKLATLEYVDGLNNDLSSLKRETIDFKKLETFLIKTGMKEGQRNSWLKDIKKLIVE